MDDAGGLAQVAGELQPSWEDKYCRAKRPDDTIGLLGMLVDFLDQNWERYHRMCLMSYDALSTWRRRRRMSQPQKAREVSVRGSGGERLLYRQHNRLYPTSWLRSRGWWGDEMNAVGSKFGMEYVYLHLAYM